MWDPQLNALERYFQVLRYDARGHGASKLTAQNFTMIDLVGDVIDLWDGLDIERSHFIGLSVGGMTGIGLAINFPHRLTRLIACDCRLDAPDFFCDMWNRRIANIEQGGMQSIVDGVLSTWLCSNTWANAEFIVENARSMVLDTSSTTYISFARALQTLDYKKSVTQLSLPVLYIVGELDGVHPQEMAELQSLTPDSRLVTLANASHLSNLEQAGAFNQAIRMFLQPEISSHA